MEILKKEFRDSNTQEWIGQWLLDKTRTQICKKRKKERRKSKKRGRTKRTESQERERVNAKSRRYRSRNLEDLRKKKRIYMKGYRLKKKREKLSKSKLDSGQPQTSRIIKPLNALKEQPQGKDQQEQRQRT